MLLERTASPRFLYFFIFILYVSQSLLSVKVRPLLDHLRQQYQEYYILEQELSIDENMIPYKGRAKNIHYNKSKHKRWGFLSHELTEASTGYLYDFWLSCNEEVSTVLCYLITY